MGDTTAILVLVLIPSLLAFVLLFLFFYLRYWRVWFSEIDDRRKEHRHQRRLDEAVANCEVCQRETCRRVLALPDPDPEEMVITEDGRVVRVLDGREIGRVCGACGAYAAVGEDGAVRLGGCSEVL